MKAIHVLSTAPWRAAYGTGSSFRMDTPEFMTLLLACLEWRRRGEFELYTDDEGEAWAKEHRLDQFYTKIVKLPTLKRINAQIFWDLPKIIALDMSDGQGVIADTDLVWFGGNFKFGVAVGHAEPLTWPCYANNRDRYEGYGFSYGWNWAAPAYNTCILEIEPPCLRRNYVAWALNFAENYSQNPIPDNPDWRFEPAMFAGQRLLGMTLDRCGFTALDRPLELFSLRHTHHEPTKKGFHLWNRKLVYRQCLEPRIALLNWLRDRITAHKSEQANQVLKQHNCWIEFNKLTERPMIQANGLAALQNDSLDTPLTRTVILNGSQDRCAKVTEPCTGLEQWLGPGVHKIYRGDVVTLCPDAEVRFLRDNNPLYELRALDRAIEIKAEAEARVWDESGESRTGVPPVSDNERA